MDSRYRAARHSTHPNDDMDPYGPAPPYAYVPVDPFKPSIAFSLNNIFRRGGAGAGEEPSRSGPSNPADEPLITRMSYRPRRDSGRKGRKTMSGANPEAVIGEQGDDDGGPHYDSAGSPSPPPMRRQRSGVTFDIYEPRYSLAPVESPPSPPFPPRRTIDEYSREEGPLHGPPRTARSSSRRRRSRSRSRNHESRHARDNPDLSHILRELQRRQEQLHDSLKAMLPPAPPSAPQPQRQTTDSPPLDIPMPPWYRHRPPRPARGNAGGHVVDPMYELYANASRSPSRSPSVVPSVPSSDHPIPLTRTPSPPSPSGRPSSLDPQLAIIPNSGPSWHTPDQVVQLHGTASGRNDEVEPNHHTHTVPVTARPEPANPGPATSPLPVDPSSVSNRSEQFAVPTPLPHSQHPSLLNGEYSLGLNDADEFEFSDTASTGQQTSESMMSSIESASNAPTHALLTASLRSHSRSHLSSLPSSPAPSLLPSPLLSLSLSPPSSRSVSPVPAQEEEEQAQEQAQPTPAPRVLFYSRYDALQLSASSKSSGEARPALPDIASIHSNSSPSTRTGHIDPDTDSPVHVRPLAAYLHRITVDPNPNLYPYPEPTPVFRDSGYSKPHPYKTTTLARPPPPPTPHPPPASTQTHASAYTYVIAFLIDTLPRQVYLYMLLRLPYLYFSRVTRIFEEAEMSMPMIRKGILDAARAKTGIEYDNLDLGVGHRQAGGMGVGGVGLGMGRSQPRWPLTFELEPPVESVAYANLQNTWQAFIDSLLREWKTLNIISVLLLSAILTILQIESAASDPLTRFSALLSMICALMSLLYGCIYIIRFGTMRKTYKGAEWAQEAQKSRAGIFWNVWVLLAMPATWLAWSMILYIITIMAFVWRTSPFPSLLSSSSPGSVSTSTSGQILVPRIIITLVLCLGLVYFVLIAATLRRYGEIMDRAWQRRIWGWIRDGASGVGGGGGGGRVREKEADREREKEKEMGKESREWKERPLSNSLREETMYPATMRTGAWARDRDRDGSGVVQPRAGVRKKNYQSKVGIVPGTPRKKAKVESWRTVDTSRVEVNPHDHDGDADTGATLSRGFQSAEIDTGSSGSEGDRNGDGDGDGDVDDIAILRSASPYPNPSLPPPLFSASTSISSNLITSPDPHRTPIMNLKAPTPAPAPAPVNETSGFKNRNTRNRSRERQTSAEVPSRVEEDDEDDGENMVEGPLPDLRAPESVGFSSTSMLVDAVTAGGSEVVQGEAKEVDKKLRLSLDIQARPSSSRLKDKNQRTSKAELWSSPPIDAEVMPPEEDFLQRVMSRRKLNKAAKQSLMLPEGRRPLSTISASRSVSPESAGPLPTPSIPPDLSFDQDTVEYNVFLNHSPHRVLYHDQTFPTAMHLLEALKFMDHRPDIVELLRACNDIDEVCPLAAQFKEFQKPGWMATHLDMMDKVLLLKFKQHPDLRLKLLDTHARRIVYIEPDDYWGVGRDGTGENMLGKALVRVREALRTEAL